MARISKEPLTRLDGKASLIPLHVIVVRVASFAFRFGSVKRLQECVKYYQKKTRRAQAAELRPRPLRQTSDKIGEMCADGR